MSREVTVQSNANYAWTGWSTPGVYDYIVSWFSAAGWAVSEPHTMKFDLSGNQNASLSMTFWVDDQYSDFDVHDSFATTLQSITYYSPLYGSTRLVNILYGISVDDPNGSTYTHTAPVEDPTVPSVEPVRAPPTHAVPNIIGVAPVDTPTGTQNPVIPNSLSLADIEKAISTANPFSKDNILAEFGVTTPTLVIGGIATVLLLIVVLSEK